MRDAVLDDRQIEVQVVRIGRAERGRPTLRVIADIQQIAKLADIACVAEARGGYRAAGSGTSSRWIEASRNPVRGTSHE